MTKIINKAENNLHSSKTIISEKKIENRKKSEDNKNKTKNMVYDLNFLSKLVDPNRINDKEKNKEIAKEKDEKFIKFNENFRQNKEKNKINKKMVYNDHFLGSLCNVDDNDQVEPKLAKKLKTNASN